MYLSLSLSQVFFVFFLVGFLVLVFVVLSDCPKNKNLVYFLEGVARYLFLFTFFGLILVFLPEKLMLVNYKFYIVTLVVLGVLGILLLRSTKFIKKSFVTSLLEGLSIFIFVLFCFLLLFYSVPVCYFWFQLQFSFITFESWFLFILRFVIYPLLEGFLYFTILRQY